MQSRVASFWNDSVVIALALYIFKTHRFDLAHHGMLRKCDLRVPVTDRALCVVHMLPLGATVCIPPSVSY